MKLLIFARFCLLLGGCLVLTACGSSIAPTESVWEQKSSVNPTAVQQTLAAHGTQAITLSPQPETPTNLDLTGTITATPGALQPTPFTQTPMLTPVKATSTPASPDMLTPASPSPTGICDKASAGFPKIDITVDDNTTLQPAQTFTKIWRLTNVGTCTWTRQYSARFSHGDQMGAAAIVALPNDVPPGESVEIVVDMVAPTLAGTYRGNWKLTNAAGTWFGIGPGGDSPFWVQIIVVAPSTATVTPTPSPSATPTITLAPSITPSPTSTPVVLASGILNLMVTDRLDLDKALVNPDGGEDLAYQTDTSAFHMLTPLSGALLGVYGASRPSRQDCLSAGMSAAPIAVESLSPGTYLCYRTESGLPGWLLLNNTNPDDFTLSIEVLTWSMTTEWSRPRSDFA